MIDAPKRSLRAAPDPEPQGVDPCRDGDSPGTGARGRERVGRPGMAPPTTRVPVVGVGWRAGTAEELAVAGSVLAAGLVCAAAFLWHPHFVNASARAGIDTTVTLCALLTSVLLVLQVRVRPRTHDLLLLSALVAVALFDFVFTALPGLTGLHHLPYGFDVRLVLAAIVPVTFAVAAFSTAAGATVRETSHIALAAAGCLVLVSAVEAFDLVSGRYGGGIGVGVGLGDTINAVEAVVFIAAGIGFVVSNGQSRHGGLLAGTCFLLAGVRICAVALPTVGSDWVTLRDPPRLAAYALLLTAVAVDWIALGRSRQDEAVAAERERIAREIHDGLAQDLATIALHAQQLEATYGAEHPVTVAARRALGVSRNTIIDLSASQAPTTVAALRAVADELEARLQLEITVIDGAVSERVDLNARAREQVVRIAREAIVNAARHGHARHVEVSLRSIGARWLLRVTDDGLGIAESAVDGSPGFGLRTMRARADELDGELSALPGPEGGTIIQLSMPARSGR
jgi:signal transduction histidine kinase